MLRVIIADDEVRICKLIQILADWEKLGMEVVGVANSGLDALALIRTLSPDILITDIRMPGCDGLAVISEAKAMLPELEVIIISGYAQFDYARTAIQYGVGEYLLKPINKDDLNNTLAKMGETCRARRAALQDMDQLRMQTQEDGNRLRENLLADLLAGRYAAKDAGTLSQAYHFAAGDGAYQLFLLKLDYPLAQFTQQSLDILCEKARDILTPVLADICHDHMLLCGQTAIYGLMNYPADRQGMLRSRLRDCLNQLVARQSLFGPVVFSMALSPALDSPAALPEGLENIRYMIAERLTEGTGRLLEGSAYPSAAPERGLLARYMQDATHAIDILSSAEAALAVDALEKAIAACPDIRGGEMLALVRDAGIMFVSRIGPPQRDEVLLDFENGCGQCYTLHTLCECLKALQESLIVSALARRENQDGRPIRMAKQYIQQHYAQPLSLEEVSAAIGFSVNYFSTFFKKETGEGFAKYVTRIRMDAAKGLLRETRLPVQEICKRVGYGDIKHFTRTFRAETGLTPGEFRKLYG